MSKLHIASEATGKVRPHRAKDLRYGRYDPKIQIG